MNMIENIIENIIENMMDTDNGISSMDTHRTILPRDSRTSFVDGARCCRVADDNDDEY